MADYPRPQPHFARRAAGCAESVDNLSRSGGFPAEDHVRPHFVVEECGAAEICLYRNKRNVLNECEGPADPFERVDQRADVVRVGLSVVLAFQREEIAVSGRGRSRTGERSAALAMCLSCRVDDGDGNLGLKEIEAFLLLFVLGGVQAWILSEFRTVPWDSHRAHSREHRPPPRPPHNRP